MVIKLWIFLALFLVVTCKSLAQDCSAERIAQDKNIFHNKFNNKEYSAAANILDNVYSSCYNEITEGAYTDFKKAASYYWLISNLMLAEYKAGRTNNCMTLGVYHTAERNIVNMNAKGSTAFKALLYNFNLCKKQREIEIGEFNKIECSFDKSNYTSRIELNDPNKEYCVSITMGNSAQKIIDAEGGKYSLEDYPYVVVQTKEGNKVEAQKLYFTSGMFSEKSYCFSPSSVGGVEFLSVMVKNGNYFIRLRSVFNYCWSGSASLLTDSVYKIDLKTGVIPVNELNVAIH